MTTLTGSRLEQLLKYDPDTGIFTWRGGHKKVRAGAAAYRAAALEQHKEFARAA